jgi:hypothetical protein
MAGDARRDDAGAMVDTVPHAGVLRAAGAAAELAIAFAAQGFPHRVKAAGESDDREMFATFVRADGGVTTCRVDPSEADRTVAHLAAWVRAK